MVGLDGFEPTIAERMIADGELPALARLRAMGAEVPLDHGAARRTGLAWEHVSTGLSPDDARRWSAVDFDPARYCAIQMPTALPPFPARLACRTLVFDAPYFHLGVAPGIQGLTGWGAHDPGVAPAARPAGIEREIGPYPATPFIYGFVWPSAERTREMARALEAAVDRRAEIAAWLLAERLPEWDLAYLVVSEYHSALEALWHGIDRSHPLHGLDSAEPARSGVECVYRAGDRLIARLIGACPDADFVFFSPHGMGPNNADVASMALLPELLFRSAFGKAGLRRSNWESLADGTPLLAEDSNWSNEAVGLLNLARHKDRLEGLMRRLGPSRSRASPGLAWMPASHYSRYWRRMRAFALPSFYDGRIRINLRGRETDGLVDIRDYDRMCGEIEALLAGCVELRTGEPIVDLIDRTRGDPLSRAASEPDLTIVWRGCPLGLVHPGLGAIGPLPYRRTGGHTGGDGIAYFIGPGIAAGRLGRRSAFDVVPTVADLMGLHPEGVLSGTSFAASVRRAA
jgi:predicted AlkP superfamily phosphohydrolase/phosphomutase